MAYTPDPSLLAAIKRYIPPRLQAAALASSLIESGGHRGAVGDQGTSFGYWQEHVGGRLTAAHHTPAMANNPAIAAQALAAEAGGIAQRHRDYDPVQVINAAQRGANPALYAQRLTSLLPTTTGLLGQPGTSVPAVGAQTQQQTAAPTQQGLSPQLMAGLQQWLGASSKQAAAGTYAGGIPSKLLTQLVAARNSQATTEVARGAAPATAPPVTTRSGVATQAALQELGVPYSWGGGTTAGPSRGIAQGAGTTGFDCSALIQYAWGKAGVSLPRTTYDQIHTGTAVPNLASAAPGDLLFPHAGHVMMYLGNGKAVESPHTGASVQVTDVTGRTFSAIRRPG